MEECTKGTGTIIRCMAKGSTTGQMAENMKVTILWTKNMVLEYTNGQTVGYMKVIGKVACNMERVNTLPNRGL